MTADRDEKHRKTREPGTRVLLDALAVGDPEEVLKLRDVLAGLGRSTFGMLLMVATLPAFIPIPGLAGALSGPLVMLVGAQLLFLLRKPWLPAFLAERGPHRKLLVSFNQRISPWLSRLEHLVKPRLTAMLDHPLATLFTGLLLVLLGLLLSLPIPFTNYLFGVLLLMFSFALLERDGALMLLAWAAGLVAIGFFGILSGNLVAMATRWIDSLF
ncbi:exopolysaccharide biosynthesis protein [Luteimonas gilva]|uniref:Exopolysaccharide biosynthesis protein n=1 Tax=Luteimonas gilva TaxID=2572684 RepID=A0A4U5JSG5_9GAMM|nr:exopolysaccharide biosynthesis protein [Luteimonas gilva]TKR32760.1 exopolysaccharide biosynthesis protein [Luteimonas gilva]